MDALKDYPQWVNWRVEPDGRKVLLNPRTGEYASVSDPATHADYNTAASTGQPVGFVFTENDPFFFLDIDKAYNDNAWSPLAIELCNTFSGAYLELSQSGKGLHIIGRSNKIRHSCKNIAHGIELYTEARFCALTGFNASGDAGLDCTTQLFPTVAKYFMPSAHQSVDWTDTHVDEAKPIKSDTKLIEKALRTKSASSAFGSGCSFADLWYTNVDALSKAYPDPGGERSYDASSADAALAQHLAFWTGKNCERMLSLMRQSALVRDKWEREDYLPRTILSAVSRQTTVYSKGEVETKPASEIQAPQGVQVVDGFQYLTIEAQLDHFKGCVYVADLNKIFTPRDGLLNQERFNAMYGGYVFQMDAMNDKVSKKPWDAFVSSQAVRHRKANSTCFRPELPSGMLIIEENQTRVNTYTPVDTPRTQGDITPFLTHLSKVLPDSNDQQILLAYMAACVQHKGVKFQWAPLLQGAEGNGKTLFTRCVAYAVGKRYTHMPPANEISEKFNEWLFGKIFIGIEDVYVPDNKKEIIEILKPMITNDELAMRAMQQSQVMGDNRANFMLNSNHKDAIRKSQSDRRFAVFFTAQQSADDIKRDGMDGDYFPNLYRWLKHEGGYAVVNEYLHTYAIPDALNPATECHRAPNTSSTHEAIKAGLGSIEQEILEAVDEERLGFAGGWISSIALDRLLQLLRAGRIIPPNKRKQLLEDMGYVHHPALKDGRVNNPILIDDNKKPRLFIKKGHISENLSTPVSVVEAYMKAQGVGVSQMAESRFGKENPQQY